jgi:hypothetical protein
MSQATASVELLACSVVGRLIKIDIQIRSCCSAILSLSSCADNVARQRPRSWVVQLKVLQLQNASHRHRHVPGSQHSYTVVAVSGSVNSSSCGCSRTDLISHLCTHVSSRADMKSQLQRPCVGHEAGIMAMKQVPWEQEALVRSRRCRCMVVRHPATMCSQTILTSLPAASGSTSQTAVIVT